MFFCVVLCIIKLQKKKTYNGNICSFSEFFRKKQKNPQVPLDGLLRLTKHRSSKRIVKREV